MIPTTPLPLLLLLLLPGPSAAAQEPPPDAREATESAGSTSGAAAELVAVPEPRLSEVEDAIRTQLRDARRELERLVGDPSTPGETLARGFGQMGQLYLLYGFDGAAEAAFANARALAPDEPAWSYYLGIIHQERGALDRAEQALRRVLEAREDDLPTLIRLGRVALERGEPEAAREHFERAAEIAPDAAAVLEGLGQAASRLGEHEAAVRAFELALERQPQATALHYPLALAYRQLGRVERAREHLELRGDEDTSFPDPLWDGLFQLAAGSSLAIEEGNRSYQYGDLEGAARAYRKAAEADPDNAQARRALASVVAEMGEREKAIALYREALGLDPDHASSHYNLGNLLVAAGRLGDAVEHFERAVELAPDFANAYYNLARALEELGEDEAARNAASRAVESLPEDPESRLLRARLEMEERLREGADLPSLLDELRPRPMDGGAALLALGVLADDRGAEDLALRAYRAAVGAEGVEPAFAARAHLVLGDDLLSRGETERSLPHLRSAVELAPNLTAAHLALARALGRGGDFEAAARAFGRAVDREPDRAEAHFGRATALMLAGREEQARQQLEQSLRTLPRSVPLRHALARLLATAEDPAARDGETALEMAREVFSGRPTLDHAETVAMALAELGRFEEAAAWQQRVVAKARELGRDDQLPRLRRRLELYRTERPVRSPWR